MRVTMKGIYIAVGLIACIQLLLLPDPEMALSPWVTATASTEGIVQSIVQDTGVTNTVSGVIFRSRLYDTIFEVVVFTIAIMGVKFLLANERPSFAIYQFTDEPSIVLARLGATISALVCIELAIRGHLSPGGGFAAGVAGGTAIGLVAITSSTQRMENLYQRYRAAAWEKISVLIFVILAVMGLLGLSLPQGELGSLLSGGWIPILNVLVALKVTLGSWAAILLFIRYRGLL